MSIFNQGFPNVAYYIPDSKNLGGRVAFKCRVAVEGVQFFSQPISGLTDIGTNLSIVTWRKFEFKQGAKVLYNDILYSVQSIMPYIADPSRQGFTKSKTDVEYLISLV